MFISLHNHTNFSILDALPSPQQLMERAKELNQSAIAITDHGSLASAWEAYKASKSVGIKLIIGVESYFVNSTSQKEFPYRHIILLAKNAIGYKNLLTLNRIGFDTPQDNKKLYSIIDFSILEKYKEGLICLTSCGNGIVSSLLMKKEFDKAEETVLKLKSIFGSNLGLEVQATNLKRGSSHHHNEVDQIYLNRRLIELGKKHDIRIVPTCNTHYLKKEDSETHDVLLAIGSHQPVYSNFRVRYPQSDFYLKSEEEIISFFGRNYPDLVNDMISNTEYFSSLCEAPDWIDPKYSNSSGKELPIFPVKDEPDYDKFLSWKNNSSLSEDVLYLRYRCEQAWDMVPQDMDKEYRERLAEELDVIEYHGFSSYMLIVSDFINWARKNLILVGPGRGSCGGSLIAYLLGIHQADPIKYGLIFARFHNKEKSSFPDIDVDFAPSGRDKVQNYIRQKYGEEYVCHVSNVNTITPKVYVRDISRSCEFGGSRSNAVTIGNNIADIIPASVKTMKQLSSEVPLYDEYVKQYPNLKQYSIICGQKRAWSTHAGGLIISARPLVGLVPLRKDKDGSVAIEYDKDKAEENGLVKMDTLGLSTLDIIQKTVELIKANDKEAPKFDYDVYDEATYDLISRGDTFCVFQLGTSAGTIDLCKKIKPKNIDDISHINSLARPSAKEMRQDFVDTKNGLKPVNLIHPKLERAFGSTFGFGLYEESLFYLAQDVAGWTLNEADRLRKLTKEKGKNPEKTKKLEKEFISGALKNGVEESVANKIWDIVADFAGYGFNQCLRGTTHIDIYTKDGNFLESKQIKDIKPGEFVRSRDEASQQEIFVEVLGLYDNGNLPLVEVELANEEKVQCTMNHKFRTKETKQMLPLHQIIKENLSIEFLPDVKTNGVKNFNNFYGLAVRSADDCLHSYYERVERSGDKLSFIKSVTNIGEHQVYDIAVDHVDHQYYLSNGMLTSNSHSILYSLTSYQTAYLKAHYPIEFLLINLMEEIGSSAPNAKSNIAKIKQELKNHNVKIVFPDINQSDRKYKLINDNQLLTGLDAIRNVGEDAITEILEKRPFSSFFDFMVRCSVSRVRANAIQALIAAGCFDKFSLSRKDMFLYCSDYRKKLGVWLKKHDPNKETFSYNWTGEEWSIPERYALEEHFVGEGFICKSYQAYGDFFKQNHTSLSRVQKMDNRSKVENMRFIIKDLFIFKIKKETSKYYGQDMMKIRVEDALGTPGVLTVFPDVANGFFRFAKMKCKKGDMIGAAIHVGTSVSYYEDEFGLIVNQIYDMVPSPQMPEDLKSRKISIKIEKEVNAELDPEEIFNIIEEEMINEGLIDLDD